LRKDSIFCEIRESENEDKNKEVNLLMWVTQGYHLGTFLRQSQLTFSPLHHISRCQPLIKGLFTDHQTQHKPQGNNSHHPNDPHSTSNTRSPRSRLARSSTRAASRTARRSTRLCPRPSRAMTLRQPCGSRHCTTLPKPPG
jgi:hypothetical protein